MSAWRSIPEPSGLVNASFSPVSGQGCPGGTTGPAGKRWPCRAPWVRWSAAPWMCTSWQPREVPGDPCGGRPWRSGRAMSAWRSIPEPSGLVNASFSPVSGQGCPGGTTGPAGKRWPCRAPWVRWSAAPWMCTSWQPREVPGDRPGTGASAPGDLGVSSRPSMPWTIPWTPPPASS